MMELGYGCRSTTNGAGIEQSIDAMSVATEFLKEEANQRELNRRSLMLNNSLERMMLLADDSNDWSSSDFCCTYKELQASLQNLEVRPCHLCIRLMDD